MDNKLDLPYNILYSCAYQKEQSVEQFFPEHALGIMLCGESHFFTNEGTFILKEGTIGLMRRNQLVKKLKMPASNGEPFRFISIFFNQNMLRQYVAENDIPKQNAYKGPHAIDLTSNIFLKGFLIHCCLTWIIQKTLLKRFPH